MEKRADAQTRTHRKSHRSCLQRDWQTHSDRREPSQGNILVTRKAAPQATPPHIAWRDEQKRGRGCWPPVTREAGQSGEGLDPREGGLAGRHAERAGHMEQGARAIQASKSRDSQQGGQRPDQTRTCEPATWRLRQVVRH